MNKWQKRICFLLSPKDNKNPNSILYWRERIFYTILLVSLILGGLTIIPSIISGYNDGLFSLIVIDLAIVASVGYFLFDSKIPFKIKSNIFLLSIFILSVSLIIMGGTYILGGFIYLIAFSVTASIWRGTKIAAITIVINMLTFILIGYLVYRQLLHITHLSSYSLSNWVTLGSNLFLVNVITAVSVGLLIDGLERTINQTIKLKNQLAEEKIKLMEAKQKAEEADGLKTIFLGNVTHELKTPLNAVIGFPNLILDAKIDDLDKIYNFQKIIAESGEMLLNLINDILDVTTIESGQLRIDKRMVRLKDIITEISHTFDDTLIETQHKNIRFNIIDKLNQDDFSLATDPMRLKQVIINLVKNALKFTEKGEISLSFELTDDKRHLLFKVKDTGIGIRAEHQKEIFNRFSKLDDPGNNKIKGTGLGLAISKEIVERFNGQIWVESVHGKGSTFYFTVQITHC